MSNANFPTNVHILRPRKVTLAEKLDRFLDEHGLEPDQTPTRYDLSRPKSINANALNCAACGEPEYLTREYCRCGHYLRGQLEDEYLAWEKRLHKDHIELASSIALKIKPLRYLFAVGMPFLVVPLLYLNLWASSFSLYPVLWMTPGIMIAGMAALTEAFLNRPLEESTRFLESCSLETFIEQNYLARSLHQVT